MLYQETPLLDDGTRRYRARGGIDTSDQDAFEHILASLHDAMLNDARWPAVSGRIDEACGLKGNGLMVGEGPQDDVRALFVGLYLRGQRRGDVERNYLENYHPSTNACRAFGNSPTDSWCPTRTCSRPRS